MYAYWNRATATLLDRASADPLTLPLGGSTICVQSTVAPTPFLPSVGGGGGDNALLASVGVAIFKLKWFCH